MSGDDFFKHLFLRQASISLFITIVLYYYPIAERLSLSGVSKQCYSGLCSFSNLGFVTGNCYNHNHVIRTMYCYCLWVNYRLIIAGTFNIYKDHAFYPGKSFLHYICSNTKLRIVNELSTNSLSGSLECYWSWWEISYCHWCHFSGINVFTWTICSTDTLDWRRVWCSTRVCVSVRNRHMWLLSFFKLLLMSQRVSIMSGVCMVSGLGLFVFFGFILVSCF